MVKVYADNGVTGTTFQRDAFEELMEDVANKKVDCIIVKDFARFGRDALDAVDLIDVIFPTLISGLFPLWTNMTAQTQLV